MDRSQAAGTPYFTQPVRQVLAMLVVLGLVAAGAVIAREVILGVLNTNLVLNAVILGVFGIGVLACFAQLLSIGRSVGWIKDFVAQRPGVDAADAPSLLAPLAALLGSRGARMAISTSSQRTILDSVATRVDESREITRYLGNLLIFLGLLGTFWGLATTVPAMVETIRNLSPQEGEGGSAVFGRLMGGLESQLGGIGTAFSSSLLGLAGSLVIGLLDLFAGHGQNRFFRELEEWSSTITRVGLASEGGEGGDVSGALTAQLEALTTLYTQSDVSRALLDQRIGLLADAVGRLAQRLEAEAGAGARQAEALARLAEAQASQAAALDRLGGAQASQAAMLERLGGAQAAALEQLAEGQGAGVQALERVAVGQDAMIAALAEGGAGGTDAESRMRLRSIDVQLLRVLEELSAGRQESLADLRSDLAALTAAVRQLSRSAGVKS